MNKEKNKRNFLKELEKLRNLEGSSRFYKKLDELIAEWKLPFRRIKAEKYENFFDFMASELKENLKDNPKLVYVKEVRGREETIKVKRYYKLNKELLITAIVPEGKQEVLFDEDKVPKEKLDAVLINLDKRLDVTYHNYRALYWKDRGPIGFKLDTKP